MTLADPLPRRFAPRQAPAAAAVSPLLGRAAVCLPLDDVVLTAELVTGELDGVRHAGHGGALARLGWTLDGVPSELLLPASTVTSLVAPLEEAPDGTLDWANAPMLLELLLAPYLDRAEALLGQTVRFRTLERGAACDDRRGGVAVRGVLDGAPFAAWLSLAPDALAAAVRLARLLPPGPQQVPDPPVAIAARVGLARLGAGALASARVGDAVLLEDGPLQRGNVVVVVGECRTAAAKWEGGTATLIEAPRPAKGFGLEEWTMQDGQEGDPVTGALGDLRVTLVFELGRRLATLDEIRGLAAGQVLDLQRDESAPVDILANGARLGRGEIVKVGDALAVRITGLHGHD